MISIIMPAYNAEKTIKESIDSVINQTYKNWELIIINDCSKDKTLEIIDEYSKLDERIRFISNDENLKVAMSRNKGIEIAKYDYIAFLDSDDVWLNNKLEIQYNHMIENDLIFTSTDYELINEDSTMKNKVIRSKHKDYKKLLRGNCIGTSTVLIKTNTIKNFKFKDIGHEDYELWLRILKENQISVHEINQSLTLHRVGNVSISSNKIKAAKWAWDIFRKEEGKNIVLTLYLFFRYILNSLTKTRKVKKNERY